MGSELHDCRFGQKDQRLNATVPVTPRALNLAFRRVSESLKVMIVVGKTRARENEDIPI